MTDRRGIVKVLMAQFPLETHSRGLLTVSTMLRNEGMEIVLIGNALPERIVECAIQEDADVIGISTYCGGELILAAELMKAAQIRKIKARTVFLIGGIFPPDSIPKLKKMGFSGVFPPGSAIKDIVLCIHNALSSLEK